ncbi:MarR family winged helix-turn-helix transcriptional regulator [Leifsonia shinshuensis]|uniref:DNA-binding MarR family transcriptional regulator n=1 Tax=Leifsonia shinshuensis TaxID=150026 RepID=A0A853CNJ1_9MICO|nr:MarR family winged helix-turn-helix transcriptional regulator [Leifsonia shinshuensis]NYJ22416.1 DNA-binding MarR family transcriptional regulator [Leifsonia shinshuensis]
MTDFPEGPATSPGFLLWHATLRWQRAMVDALRPHDLTHAQFVLLASTWWLNGQSESPSQARLSEQTGSDPRMTSEIVRRLVAKGLVERATDPADSRAKVLRVTAAGAAAAEAAIGSVEAADAAFFAAAQRAAPGVLLPVLHALADR